MADSFDLETLRQLGERATKRPWMLKVVGKHGYPQHIIANDDGLVLIAETYTGPDSPPFEAEFIVAVVNQLPAIIAALEHGERLEALAVAAKELVRRGPMSGAWEPFFDAVAALEGRDG